VLIEELNLSVLVMEHAEVLIEELSLSMIVEEHTQRYLYNPKPCIYN